MSEVDGLLHGPDLSAMGVPARLQFHGGLLRVSRADGAVEDVVADLLVADVTGFNEDTLQLSWQRDGHTHAVTIADRAAQGALLAEAPTAVAQRLQRGHAQIGYHRRKWNVVVGIVAGFALLVLVAWWRSEAITMWIANRVSLETEVGIGERALAQIESEHVLTQEGVPAATVTEIGTRLTQGSRYRYRWYVSADREINAYALPGGIVIVNAGLIENAVSAEELAGVLAHEVQHIEHRHTLQQMIHSAGWAAVLAVVLGDVSGITAVIVHQLGNLRNSRTLESQADIEGMKALARAGIPLSGMPSLFRRLQEQQARRGGDGIALLSSHPATSERIVHLEQLAATLKCDCRSIALDWQSVQSLAKQWRAEQ